ncbi:hypothetical protein GCM10009801_70970 [Streptomyces albiaxialis]|uniref:DUF4253 domain-containing protein n=1 Tax=Streptomyces albiaxialis TaxID=329523 RepID=A0ABN2WV47_9ACTN
MTNDDLDELLRSWAAVYDDFPSQSGTHDMAVLNCAGELADDPAGELAHLWTFGLVVIGRHVTWLPGKGTREEAVRALRDADEALRDRPCAHDAHPYEEHEAEDDTELLGRLRELADESAEWNGEGTREEWRCPRNVAGFARIALDIIEPGSVTDVPPRLPVEADQEIEELSALLHGYPKGWTDINETITSHAESLRRASGEDLPGRIMTVRALGWYAVSGMVRDKSVLDELAEALDAAYGKLADAMCEHDWHARLPKDGPHAAEIGVILSSPGGRAAFERSQRRSGRAPMDRVVCPVFARELAVGSLRQVEERRENLFGERDTAHLDAEYLLDGGRLDIEKIAERIDKKAWNEEFADDLGLWAARRYEASEDESERAALLLTAYQTMRNAYPSPVLAAVRGVSSVMRPLAAADAGECAHEDAHPTLRYVAFRKGLPHLVAPEAHPADPEESRSPESWACPVFAAEVARDCLQDLEGLYAE